MKTSRSMQALPLAAAMLLAGTAAHAGENNGSSYAPGIENFMVGATPPPGVYGQVYGYFYSANRLKDNDGKSIPVNFNVDSNVIAPRLVWVSNTQLFGGSLVAHTILPFVDLDTSLNVAPGMRLNDDRRTQGDITIGAGLGYHYSEKLHAIVAVDVIAPTGAYDAGRLANPGRNYWAIQPIYALDYIDPTGFNAAAKIMYQFNFRNSDTAYRSGQELIIDYAAGWAVARGWTLGVGGFIYQQTTNDRLHGRSLSGSKGRAFAIGPSLKYDSGKGWHLTAKYAPEFEVRNRPDGAVFTVKAAFPL